MSSGHLARAPIRRGPLTIYEARDFNRLLTGPISLHSFAAFGTQTALNHLDVRGVFGVPLPSAVRKAWWLRLVDLAAMLSARAMPDCPAMETAEGRSWTEAEVTRALASFADFHAARVAPLVAGGLAQRGHPTEMAEASALYGSGKVVRFPGGRASSASTSDDSTPSGGA